MGSGPIVFHISETPVFVGCGVRAVGVKGTGNREQGIEDDEGL